MISSVVAVRQAAVGAVVIRVDASQRDVRGSSPPTIGSKARRARACVFSATAPMQSRHESSAAARSGER
jgi:hypothetical protein